MPTVHDKPAAWAYVAPPLPAGFRVVALNVAGQAVGTVVDPWVAYDGAGRAAKPGKRRASKDQVRT